MSHANFWIFFRCNSLPFLDLQPQQLSQFVTGLGNLVFVQWQRLEAL